MSAVAVPPTKVFGCRPPFVPPVVTGFDGDSGREEEPYHRVLVADVRRLIRTVERYQFDASQSRVTLLGLVVQRKRAVERELDVLRMLAPEIMPPAAMMAFEGDTWLEDDDIAATYVRLLDDLEAARLALSVDFFAINDFPLSSDL